MIAIYSFSVPEEIVKSLDLGEKSQINIYSIDYQIIGKEVLITHDDNGNGEILERFKLPNRKLFALVDQARIQEGSQGKELVVKTKTIWPLCIGAFLFCLVFSVGINMLLKNCIR